MNKILSTSVIAAALGLGTSLPLSTFALNGNPGFGASGKSDVDVALSFIIPRIIRLAGVDAPSLSASAGGDVTSDDSVCVFTNKSGNLYNVTADSTNGSGAFTLSGGGESLAYTVSWYPAATGGSATVLADGDVSTADFDAGAPSLAKYVCSGGAENARFEIFIDDDNYSVLTEANSLSDTLNLEIEHA